ncbi:MAG: hypothetical protein WA418_39280 [Bradyrhizobium sp.]
MPLRERAEHVTFISTVMPANAGIQYAVTARLNHERLWNTGSSAFAFADDDSVCMVSNNA